MEFSRQEYWSGLPFPSLGDLPDPGMEPRSPALQADSLLSKPPGKPHVNQNDSQHPTAVPRLCQIRTPLHYLTGFASYDSPPLIVPPPARPASLFCLHIPGTLQPQNFCTCCPLCLGYSFSVINRPHPPTSFRSLLKCHFVSEGPLTSLSQVEETPTPFPYSISPSEQAGGGQERTGSGLAPGDSREVQE